MSTQNVWGTIWPYVLVVWHALYSLYAADVLLSRCSLTHYISLKMALLCWKAAQIQNRQWSKQCKSLKLPGIRLRRDCPNAWSLIVASQSVFDASTSTQWLLVFTWLLCAETSHCLSNRQFKLVCSDSVNNAVVSRLKTCSAWCGKCLKMTYRPRYVIFCKHTSITIWTYKAVCYLKRHYEWWKNLTY